MSDSDEFSCALKTRLRSTMAPMLMSGQSIILHGSHARKSNLVIAGLYVNKLLADLSINGTVLKGHLANGSCSVDISL